MKSYKKEYVRLSDLGQIVTGKTPPTDTESYYNGEYPFITPTDIKTYDVKYIEKTDRSLSDLGADFQKKLILPKNSICFVCIGSTIGKMCMTNRDSFSNQQINTIIPNNKVNPEYLFYFLRYIRSYFQSIGGGTGSGKSIVNKTTFSNSKVEYISELNIQKRIANLLSKYDSLIESNNKRIKILEQMAEELYKEWFVRFRFPDFKTSEFENGIPKGWKIYNCSDLAYIKAGGDRPDVFSKTINEDLCVPIFSNGIENEGLYGYTDKPIIKNDSVTISARGTVGFVCLRRTPYVPIVRLIAIVPDAKIVSSYYLYYYLKNDQVIGNGTSQQQITVPMVNKKKILVPSLCLLETFNEKEKIFFNKIDIIKKQNENLIKQRDLLLPRLMSGKLEV